MLYAGVGVIVTGCIVWVLLVPQTYSPGLFSSRMYYHRFLISPMDLIASVYIVSRQSLGRKCLRLGYSGIKSPNLITWIIISGEC